jgi:cyclopropane fatty-acyl-phospholipid synthase-like methyltransferase
VRTASPAFERNREPITGVLGTVLADVDRVLEIGSGSGEHVVWFARGFPNVTWHPSDLALNLPAIEARRIESGLTNIEPAVEIDVLSDNWPDFIVDAVVTINTLHIVSKAGVESMIRHGAAMLRPGGLFFAYGPFRYASRELEPSNRRFDERLRQFDPESGVREFEWVDSVAEGNALTLVRDVPMPANNRSIWWRKIER